MSLSSNYFRGNFQSFIIDIFRYVHMYNNRGGLMALLHLPHYESIERADWLLAREFLGFRKFLATVANQTTKDTACHKTYGILLLWKRFLNLSL